MGEEQVKGFLNQIEIQDLDVFMFGLAFVAYSVAVYYATQTPGNDQMKTLAEQEVINTRSVLEPFLKQYGISKTVRKQLGMRPLEDGAIAQRISTELRTKLGGKKYLLFAFAVKMSQFYFVSSKSGSDWKVDAVQKAEVMRIGREIGFRQEDLERWIQHPNIETISEIRQKLLEGGDYMDITPFIPIIVEATKFIFDEVSKWISDVRRRAAQESGPPVGSILPVTKEQFSSIEANPSSVVRLLNQFATQADITEISNLLEQLKTRRALFLELESQEITAAGAEAAKLRVNIQNVARDIIKTAERLEKALARVYRSG